MATTVTCFCGRTFPAPDEKAGGYVRCPVCGDVVYVPWPLPTRQVRHHAPGGLGWLLKALGVVMVLGFLTGLLLPAVSHCGAPMQRAQCMNNLKQIALALEGYRSVHGCFPPAATYDREGHPLLSWRVLILPQMDGDGLYQQFHLDEPWNSPHNLALLAQEPSFYRCPSERDMAPDRTTYVVVVGAHTMFPPFGPGVKLDDVPDGPSQTITVVESTVRVPWTAPEDIPDHVGRTDTLLGSHHAGGFCVAFSDGSVRFLKDSTRPRNLEALMTRDGHETVDFPECCQ